MHQGKVQIRNREIIPQDQICPQNAGLGYSVLAKLGLNMEIGEVLEDGDPIAMED